MKKGKMPHDDRGKQNITKREQQWKYVLTTLWSLAYAMKDCNQSFKSESQF